MKETGSKKNLNCFSPAEKKLMVGKDNNLPIIRQCELIGISRSATYYRPVICEKDIIIMNAIDEIYTMFPYYGKRRMCEALKRKGFNIGIPHTRALMDKMGLEAVYPKPRLSKKHPEHKIYPYLLRGIKINRVNQVWSTDITYIKLNKGFVYLTAVIDWFSRYVLSWKTSLTLEKEFCEEALKEALDTGHHPEIFNSDQGSQFTSPSFTDILKRNNIKISMDGRGRWQDNIFTERLWRSVKYDEVYIKQYSCPREAYEGLKNYFYLYNFKRLHQSLGYMTPAEIFLKKCSLKI